MKKSTLTQVIRLNLVTAAYIFVYTIAMKLWHMAWMQIGKVLEDKNIEQTYTAEDVWEIYDKQVKDKEIRLVITHHKGSLYFHGLMGNTPKMYKYLVDIPGEILYNKTIKTLRDECVMNFTKSMAMDKLKKGNHNDT